MKKKSLQRWERRHSRDEICLMPDHAMETIRQWQDRCEEDPEHTPEVLELTWTDRNCILGGISIKRVPVEDDENQTWQYDPRDGRIG